MTKPRTHMGSSMTQRGIFRDPIKMVSYVYTKRGFPCPSGTFYFDPLTSREVVKDPMGRGSVTTIGADHVFNRINFVKR